MHTTFFVLHHVLLAAGSSGTSKKKGGSPYFIFILIGIFAVVYIAFLRPRANRQRAAMASKRSAEVGDEITTTSGLIATVIAMDDDAVTLEIAPGVHARYVPAAIMRVNGDDEPEPDDDETEHEHESYDITNHEVIDDPTIVAPAADTATVDDESATPSTDQASDTSASDTSDGQAST